MFRNLLIGRKYLNKDSRLISEILRVVRDIFTVHYWAQYAIYENTSNLLTSCCQKCDVMVLT